MIAYEQYENIQLIALLREDKNLANKAFNVIYDRYNNQLYSYCFYKTDTVEEAKDLCQETWLKFIEQVKSVSSDLPLPVCLFKIAQHTRINEINSARNKAVVKDEGFEIEKVADVLNFYDHIEKKELVSYLNLAISTLTEPIKNAFLLKWISGLSYADIADVTGETTDCIRHRCYRAIDELTKILKPIIDDIK